MNQEANGRCKCGANCPGSSCQCGCQATISAMAPNFAGLACNCGTGCGCEGGEQGCLCRR